MIVRESNFEVIEKYKDLSDKEKADLGLSKEDCLWTDADFLEADDFCFYCSEPLTLPCIMWSGEAGRQIYLHPKCVNEFAYDLMRDAEELSVGKVKADELYRQRKSS